MNWKIIKNELRNLSLDRSIPALLVVLGVLLAYGLFNASKWVEARSANGAELIAAQERTLAEKRDQVAAGFTGSNEPGNFVADPTDPFTIGAELQHAVLPFLPSAFFAVGQSDVLPLETGVSIVARPGTKADKTGFENPLSFLYGRFDAAFVVVYLLPLLILALCFGVLSGEREQGTLQLILSQPVSASELLFSKLFAQFVLIGATLTLALFAGFILAGSPPSSSDLLINTALWVILVTAYAGFWFSVGAIISSLGYSSSTNAVAAASAWLLFVLIIPSLLGIAVSAAYPLPPRGEVTAAVRNINLDTRRDGEKLLSEFYQDHPELIPKDGGVDAKNLRLAYVFIQAEHKRKIAEIEAEFDEQMHCRQGLVSMFRFLSPAIITNEALNDIAGTGLARYTNYRRQAKAFDVEWSEHFQTKIFRKEKLVPEDFDSVPRFSFQDEPMREKALRVLGGTAVLFVAAAFLFWYAGRRLYRFRIDR